MHYSSYLFVVWVVKWIFLFIIKKQVLHRRKHTTMCTWHTCRTLQEATYLQVVKEAGRVLLWSGKTKQPGNCHDITPTKRKRLQMPHIQSPSRSLTSAMAFASSHSTRNAVVKNLLHKIGTIVRKTVESTVQNVMVSSQTLCTYQG